MVKVVDGCARYKAGSFDTVAGSTPKVRSLAPWPASKAMAKIKATSSSRSAKVLEGSHLSRELDREKKDFTKTFAKLEEDVVFLESRLSAACNEEAIWRRVSQTAITDVSQLESPINDILKHITKLRRVVGDRDTQIDAQLVFMAELYSENDVFGSEVDKLLSRI